MRDKKKVGLSIVKTLMVLGVATALSLWQTVPGIGRESVILIYLLGVLFVNILTYGYLYSLIASIASVMLLNYFFTRPQYTFLISSAEDVMLLGFFLITSVVSGTVTTNLQRQMALSHKNEMTARLLYEVSAGFVHATGESSIAQRGIGYIREHTGCESRVTLDKATYGDPPKDAGVAESLAIPGASRTLGTLTVYHKPGEAHSELAGELIVHTVLTQLGIALDREYTYREREEIRVAMEREQLRSTLLRAVAHDLRSPLTALSGASALLADNYDHLTDQERRRLASDLSEEIVWLTNLVENILNMTRVSDNFLSLSKQDEVVDDVASEAVGHMRRLLNDRVLRVKLPDEVVVVPMDGRLITQVLINLIDNAVKHTSPGDTIELRVQAGEGVVTFVVEDSGEGINDKVKDTLFEGFVTLERRVTDGKRGIGLGLAIAKSVVEAHGGEIHAENRKEGGARFTFTLPWEGRT
ncbi:MAG: ATP-binding protein [Clostridia bacterium]